MHDALQLPVSYQGHDYEFPFTVAMHGYVQRYLVMVNDVEVIYERDDSGELRALIQHPDQLRSNLPEHGLLKAIADVLTQLIS